MYFSCCNSMIIISAFIQLLKKLDLLHSSNYSYWLPFRALKYCIQWITAVQTRLQSFDCSSTVIPLQLFAVCVWLCVWHWVWRFVWWCVWRCVIAVCGNVCNAKLGLTFSVMLCVTLRVMLRVMLRVTLSVMLCVQWCSIQMINHYMNTA